MKAIADKTVYCNNPRYKVLDLRPEGIDCIPVLGFSDFLAVQQAPELHYHPGCMEFCLCLKGNATLETSEGDYPFLSGSIFAFSPDEPHHLSNNPSGLSTRSVQFRIPRENERILGLDLRESRWISKSLTHLPKHLFATTPAVKDSFKRLFDNYANIPRRSPSRSVKMKAAALDLLLAIIDASRRTPVKTPEKIRNISRRIRENPAEKYPIERLAEECGVSVSTFANDFKRAEGLPLHAYLLNCRISKAKTLLLNSERTVSDIGHELRFYSTQHFARIFRQIVGVNPREFRRREAYFTGNT